MSKKTIWIALAIVASMMLAVTTVAADDNGALEDPIPEPIEAGSLEVRLESVASGMTAPNWGTAVPGCTALRGRLVVADQDGALWAGFAGRRRSGFV